MLFHTRNQTLPKKHQYHTSQQNNQDCERQELSRTRQLWMSSRLTAHQTLSHFTALVKQPSDQEQKTSSVTASWRCSMTKWRPYSPPMLLAEYRVPGTSLGNSYHQRSFHAFATSADKILRPSDQLLKLHLRRLLSAAKTLRPSTISLLYRLHSQLQILQIAPAPLHHLTQKKGNLRPSNHDIRITTAYNRVLCYSSTIISCGNKRKG